MGVWDELSTFIGHYSQATGKNPVSMTITKEQHGKMLASCDRRTDVVIEKNRVVSYRGVRIDVK